MLKKTVRDWDWSAVITGGLIGFVMKIILEIRRYHLKTAKNVIFILIALYFMGLFMISEDNNLIENLKTFEPAQLIPAANPSYIIFGLLVIYIISWIIEILEKYEKIERVIKFLKHPKIIKYRKYFSKNVIMSN